MNEDERKKIRKRKIAIDVSAFDDERKNYTRMNHVEFSFFHILTVVRFYVPDII